MLFDILEFYRKISDCSFLRYKSSFLRPPVQKPASLKCMFFIAAFKKILFDLECLHLY